MATIWVLTGSKTGDNAQVLRAAEAMSLPFANKRITLKPEFETVKPRVTASLHHVDTAASDSLAPPWPDLVITIGRRLSLVALWIKQQSGGKTRIALFNAAKGETAAFDLLVVPSYYRVAGGRNVMKIGLPLIAVDPARIEVARADFADSLGAMPKPLHVLLLGGDMGQRRLEPAFAVGIVDRIRQGFAKDGSIFVSTSRRTPEAVAQSVARRLAPSDRLYRWREGDTGNPYFGLLAHGDSFTVTSDSLSMITEVARLGKPLVIAEPPVRSGILGGLLRRVKGPGARDLDEAAAHLIRTGHAVRLGDALPSAAAPPPDDTLKVAARLRQLAHGRD